MDTAAVAHLFGPPYLRPRPDIMLPRQFLPGAYGFAVLCANAERERVSRVGVVRFLQSVYIIGSPNAIDRSIDPPIDRRSYAVDAKEGEGGGGRPG